MLSLSSFCHPKRSCASEFPVWAHRFSNAVMLLDRWAVYLPSGQGKPVVYRLLQVLFPLESQSSLSHSCEYPTPVNNLLMMYKHLLSSGDPIQWWPKLRLGVLHKAWGAYLLSWHPTLIFKSIHSGILMTSTEYPRQKTSPKYSFLQKLKQKRSLRSTQLTGPV